MHTVQILISSLISVYSARRYFKKQLHIKQNFGKNVWDKVFEILGDLQYSLSHVKRCFGHMRTVKAQITCASAESDRGLHCLLTESLDTTECLNGEQMYR